MKLAFRDIENFVRAPDKRARAILIYGPDSGLVRERARAIGGTVVQDLNDPFNAATLSADQIADDPARLFDEAASMSMMGGARLIRVEDATDKIAPVLKDYLANPSPHNLIVLEAGGLGPRSPLRLLCEKSDAAAALPCYVDEGRDLETLIRETLTKAGYAPERDAVSFLAANTGGDRAKVRGELEKLITYMGEDQKGARVTLSDAMASCGEAGARGLDDLAYAAAGAQPGIALATYNQLIQEGVPIIVILRTLQGHFRRLHLTRARMDNGQSAEDAMKSLNPPIFFKQQAAFKAQAGKWTQKSCLQILDRLAQIEAQCKKTGTPDETLCAQALLAISSR